MAFLARSLFLLSVASVVSTVDLSGVARSIALKRARCQASCITHFPSSNIRENNTSPCERQACQQCVAWCTSTQDICNTTCNTSECAIACDYLAHAPADIESGNNVLITGAGAPYAVNTNFTSLSLKWAPAENPGNGTVVYLLEMQYGGDKTSGNTWQNLDLISLVPYITLTQTKLCSIIPDFYNKLRDINGIYFKYRIVALTEQSKTSNSKSSDIIWLPRPPPVENATFLLGPFDAAHSGNKLQFSGDWKFHLSETYSIIKYFIHIICLDQVTWRTCTTFNPQKYDTSKTSIALHLPHMSMKEGNVLRIKVVALVGCSTSNVTTIDITYPGCSMIEDFPTLTCCQIQPPMLPENARVVRNLSHEPLQVQSDYRFKTRITWRPPTYMGKTNCTNLFKSYELHYGDPNKLRTRFGLKIWGKRDYKYSKETLEVVLEPGTTFTAKVTPVISYVDRLTRNITFMVPGVPVDQLELQNISTSKPILKSDGKFSITVSWKKPPFNYSFIDFYSFHCIRHDGRNVSEKVNPNNTSYTITDGLHGEQLTCLVSTEYGHSWIPTIESPRQLLSFPQPDKNETKIRNLRYVFTNESTTMFNVTFSWQEPSFKYSKIIYYGVILTYGANQHRYNLTDRSLTAIRMKPGEEIAIVVTSVFDNPYLEITETQLTTSAPDKKDTFAVRNPPPKALSTIAIIAIIVALLLLLLVLLSVVFLVPRCKETRKLRKEGLVIGNHGFVVDDWEIDNTQLLFEDEVGEGAFGKVYSGVLQKLPQPAAKAAFFTGIAARKTHRVNDSVTVAIKMLHSHMEQSDERNDFLQEIQLMKSVGFHSNIVNMLGCCTVKYPMCLVVEYVPYGDLLHYLRKRRGDVKEYLADETKEPYRSSYFENFKFLESSAKSSRADCIYVNEPGSCGRRESKTSDSVQILSYREKTENEKIELEKLELESPEEKDTDDDLSPGDLLAFAWQVSRGMEYLAKKGFVHRDLAARNILIGHNKVAKIADFGLTRCVYDAGGVYPVKNKRKLPLKWMSLEAIFDGIFTTQSDIWSFGILLWEIGTLGGTPYPTVNNHDLLKFLQDGHRMEKPEICNDDYYAIMVKCWKENPEERPSFEELRSDLENMMIVDRPYLEFGDLDESKDYYNVPSFHSIQEDDESEVISKEKAESSFDETNTAGFHEGSESKTVREETHENKICETEKLDMVQSKKTPCYRQESEGSERPLIKKDKNTLAIEEMQSRMCRPLARTTSHAL